MNWNQLHLHNLIEEVNDLLGEKVYTMQIGTGRYKGVKIYRYGIMVARGIIYSTNYIEARKKEQYEKLKRNV